MVSFRISACVLVLGCGSGPRPVQVPPSADGVKVGACVEVRLQSQWGARTPVPASDIGASCTDSKICKTHVSQQQAGLLYVKGLAAGSSLVELEFRDPVTKRREHKTTRVSFVGDPASNPDIPPPAESEASPDTSCGPDEF